MLPFITAFDPLGSSTGSIDPLGSLQSYGALVDLLLPGMSTITNRSRYLSMLCRAIDLVEQYGQPPPGPAGLAVRRSAIEPFERLWAAACVVGWKNGATYETLGLRGVNGAERAVRDFTKSGRITPDFKLLKYQSRTGATATYWTAMVSGSLVDSFTGALTAEGRSLAEHFPLPDSLSSAELKRLIDPELACRVSMSLDDSVLWAKKCHLTGATRNERGCLAAALTAANERRDAVATALRSMMEKQPLPNEWRISGLRRLQKHLSGLGHIELLEFPAVIEAIIRTEQFHEAVLSIFETLLWWASQPASQSIDKLTDEDDFQIVCAQARETAGKLAIFYRDCDSTIVRSALDSLHSFTMGIEASTTPRKVLECVLERHNSVQLGKLDGGAPKRDWVTWEGDGKLLRPSARFQRMTRPAPPRGARLTHPYRLEQFVYMLRENDFLPTA